MKKIESIGMQDFEIVRDETQPEIAQVIYKHFHPLLATTALNRILNGSRDTYKGVRTVQFRSADGANEAWERNGLGNYIYTGIIVTNDFDSDIDLCDYDIVTEYSVPDDVCARVVRRYCKQTGLSREDVLLSESMTHIPLAVMQKTVLEDFRAQAATYFTTGVKPSLRDKYGEQRIPGKTFAVPYYAMFLSTRLRIGCDVNLLQVRRFLSSARKDFVNCSDRQPDTTTETLLRDCALLGEHPTGPLWVENYAMTRDEARESYQRELDHYRTEEGEWEDFDFYPPFEDYEEDRDEYLLS